MDFVNEQEIESLEEGKAVDLKNTDFDYKNLSIEDLDSEDKVKRIIFKLQQEDDEKLKKFGIETLIRHIVGMILMPAFGIGFIIMVINLVYAASVSLNMPRTSWERIAKRLEKCRDKESDPKDIEKLDKLIDKLYDKAADARDTTLTAKLK